MVRRLNRKIKRGTLGHQKDPIVMKYNEIYHIGAGLVFKALTLFGDSKYTHNLCQFIQEKQKIMKTSGIKFESFIEEFETGNNKPYIESKLNLD